MAEISPDPLRQLLAQLAAQIAEHVAAKLASGREAKGQAAAPLPDPLHAYTDKEVCELLGIKPSTLHLIRDKKRLLKSSYLYPGSRVRRTTKRQIEDYFDYLSSAEATCEAEAADPRLDDRLDELDARRQRRRA